MERGVAELLCGGAELTEDLSAAYVLRGCDLLEVGGAPVEDVAVEMVDLHARRTRTYPSLIDEDVAAWYSKEVFHSWIIGVHVGLVLEILCPRRFNLVNTSPCDGKEPSVLGAVELG